MKKKVLFLIHTLGHGGAEKVLVNLVNNMDPEQFDITVMALFGGGINEQFLKSHVRLITCFPRAFPGNSHLMKLLTPRQLHRWLIKDRYDIEISYLEGSSARIVSGCPDKNTRIMSWIHCTMRTAKEVSGGFRSFAEAQKCYGKMDTIVFVSKTVRDAFLSVFDYKGRKEVLYNTNDTNQIIALAKEAVELPECSFHWCGVGQIAPVKGFDRMIRIQKRLREAGYKTHLHILGKGPLQQEMEKLAADCGVAESVSFWGYQTNPYKYIANCDLFVCSSYSEGFSTAATEALIVGTPVCTVEVSGMKEMLGENNEYGIVTENSEEALYEGLKKLLEAPELLDYYRIRAMIRGKYFNTENTVRAVEKMLLE